MHTETLSALDMGQCAVVSDIRARGELGRRLRDMGLLPGTSLRLTARAPLGDPVVVELQGCTLSLRNTEADQVIVTWK